MVGSTRLVQVISLLWRKFIMKKYIAAFVYKFVCKEPEQVEEA